MNATIKLGAHEFTVTADESKKGAMMGSYTLTKIGGRGLTYTTQRNYHNPELMSLLNMNASGKGFCPGLWVSDKGDTLVQVYVS